MEQRPLKIVAILSVIFMITIFILSYLSAENKNKSYLTINGNVIEVELAATAYEQKKGLSDREKLSADSGMLFRTIADSQPVFWMKDMRFPLDIVYINDSVVVDIKKNILPPSQTDGKPVTFVPDKPVDYVLEINSGYVENNNIKIGDEVEFKDLE